jgi:hypothetical protein
MDYTHSSFFAGAPPYQFMGAQVPPLTPSHSNSVASEDFNTTSPPVGWPPEPPGLKHGRERKKPASGSYYTRPAHSRALLGCPQRRLRISFAARGSSAHLAAGQQAYTIITQEIFDQFPNGIPPEHFPAFDNYVQFNPSQAAFPGPPTPPGQLPVHAAVPPASGVVHQPGSTSDHLAISKIEADDQSRRQGSNSEEDDLTPAQSRRKAQNRAA